MYLASPRVAEKVTGERTTAEEMGGARMHAEVSGCGDAVFDEDWQAIAAARLLFSYLPGHFDAPPPDAAPCEPEAAGWDGLVPEDPTVGYDVTAVIDRLVDGGSFFEIKPDWAPEIVVGFARLEGRVVGLVANQPRVRSGAIHVDSADKAARFISLCDAFNVPLVFLQDVPGFMVGVAVERQGIIRHGAKMITAMSSAEVPKFTIVLRKAYAAGFYAMCAPGFEPRATLALPSAFIGAMGPEASVNAVYAGKIAEIADDDERAAFVAAHVEEHRAEINLLRMGDELVVDAVVPGEELRAELVARLRHADGWTRTRGRRHHPVSPV
jgi:acetyl-CoA carboxylase carboxyltransferase component